MEAGGEQEILDLFKDHVCVFFFLRIFTFLDKRRQIKLIKYFIYYSGNERKY